MARSEPEPAGVVSKHRWPSGLAAALTLALAVLALGALALHVPSSRMVSHVNGIYLLLADLLRHGIFYPRDVSPDLVYATFYQPLAFVPYALLPGTGLDQVPFVRIVCGAEMLLCLGLLGVLAARIGVPHAARWRPVAWALCTAPVGFCLLAMREDPRGTWLGLLAVLAYLRLGRAGLPVAASCIALAFFVKLTAPFVPCVAIGLDLAVRAPRRLPAFVLATALAIGIPFAVLQWGCGFDLLDNGIRLALLEPAYQPRGLLQTAWRCLRDVAATPERAFGLLPLALVSLALLTARLARRRCDLADALVLAAFAKGYLAYRNPGADYNHLLDLALLAPLHVVVRTAAWLTPVPALAALVALLALDRPWEQLLGAKRPPLQDAPAGRVARELVALPQVPTLVEDPMVQLEARTRPIVPDGGVVFGRLRRHPEVRKRWFGPPSDPAALQRIVLLFDPHEETPDRPGAVWYGVVNYDRAFHAEVLQRWLVVARNEDAAFLERKP